jgi:hypothetical protein
MYNINNKRSRREKERNLIPPPLKMASGFLEDIRMDGGGGGGGASESASAEEVVV